MEVRILDRKQFLDLIPEIDNLHRKCFGKEKGQEYYIWKYLDNPIDDFIIACAFSKGRLASFYAVSPVDILADGIKEKALLSLNTMTDPDFAGQGLFTRLAQLVYDFSAEKYHYKLVFGFTNSISNRIFSEQLGWSTVYEVPMLQKDLSFEVKSLKSDLKVDNEFTLDYNNVLGQKKYGLRILKTEEYLKWRYMKSPESSYMNFVLSEGKTVDAYAICKFYQEDKINVVEWNSLSINSLEKLFLKLFDVAREYNRSVITTWSRVNSEEHLLLERLGFINRYPIHYFSLKVLKKEAFSLDITDYRNWNLQLGDNNTY